MNFLEGIHLVKGIDPIAQAFDGTVYTDVFKVQGEGGWGLRYDGVGAVGTSVVTCEACDDVTPTNSTAVAFMYRICTSGDTWGDWTQATTSGFTTTAGSSQMYELYVPSSELGTEGYAYCRWKFVESANDPVLGGVLCGVVNPHIQPMNQTVIT